MNAKSSACAHRRDCSTSFLATHVVFRSSLQLHYLYVSHGFADEDTSLVVATVGQLHVEGFLLDRSATAGTRNLKTDWPRVGVKTMTRINTNVSSLIAQNRLQRSNMDLSEALTRLSTGLRINSGKDDPAGLIASEALRSEITGLNKAISNTERANQIITTADSALGQVSSLLNDIRGLVVEAANTGGLSDEEIAANQLQIDSSLEAINRISQTTTFQGRKLLDGSLDYISTVGTVNSITDATINRAKIGSSPLDVEVVVSSAATQGEITAASAGFSAAAAANVSTTETTQVATIVTTGEDITVTGGPEFTSVTLTDNGGATSVSYDEVTGVLDFQGDFTTGLSPDDIAAAIDALDEFTATNTADATNVGSVPNIAYAAAGSSLLDITAANTGQDYNNVTVTFTTGAANSADYDTTQKTLTVTVDTSSSTVTLADIATAIDNHTVDGAAPASALFTATGSAAIDIQSNTAFSDVSTGNTGGEVLLDSLVFQVTGSDGAETFNFAAGTSKDQIADAVSLVSDGTGVSAAVDGSDLVFSTTGYGTNALVDIGVISEGASGLFGANLDTTRDTGEDVIATVNGIAASGDGSTLSINTSALSLSLTVDQSGNNFSFQISGGGAKFQLGPQVGSTQQSTIGIRSMSTGTLGGTSGRLYELGSGQAKSLLNDVAGASNVIDEVINRVTAIRGRLGAFQRTTLESNLVSLKDTVANLQQAESSIRDADFAKEAANLTRAQILVQSGTNVLALANQNPQNVLALFR